MNIFNRFGLVSFWGMISNYAFDFVHISRLLRSTEAGFEQLRKQRPNDFLEPMSPNAKTYKYLHDIKKTAEDMGLDSVSAQIDRMLLIVSRDYTPAEFETSLKDLQNRLQDQLANYMFFHVPLARKHYYANAESLFTPEVIKRFPAILDDVEGAGQCLALGQGTACVLHLMRVMEAGLKKLSNSLGIPYAPSWESNLTKIQSKIAENHAQKTEDWKKVEHFYRDLAGDLMVVKQCWRNPTMHVGRKYGIEEAEEIFRAVKLFCRDYLAIFPRTRLRFYNFLHRPRKGFPTFVCLDFTGIRNKLLFLSKFGADFLLRLGLLRHVFPHQLSYRSGVSQQHRTAI